MPKIVSDYLCGAGHLKPFYRFDPTPESFSDAVKHKIRQTVDRKLLVDMLMKQYTGVVAPSPVVDNISSLANPDTFTIVTAHQPLLFLGPLYFVHKAASAVKAARIAERHIPGKKVVPVFWLGSEDHDLEELGTVHVLRKTFTWHQDPGGPVGRMDCATIAASLDELDALIGQGDHARQLIRLFRQACQPGRSFSQATRVIINELFGRFGLVVIDGDEGPFKKSFQAVMHEELNHGISSRLVNEASKQLSERYKLQVKPREINLFYMLDGLRERIVREGDVFRVLNTNLHFSAIEIERELSEHPERFSPNVLLRGLYQESLLPNLAFIGGPAEVSYWLELKTLFDHFGVSLPILVLRDIMLWMDAKTHSKVEKLNIRYEELFTPEDELIGQIVKRHSEADLSLSNEIEALQKLFMTISAKAASVDPTLAQSVTGSGHKAMSLLHAIEEKMLRAAKKRSEVVVGQVKAITGHIFPDGEFQERHDSFINFYVDSGPQMIQHLIDAADPFDGTVKVLG